MTIVDRIVEMSKSIEGTPGVRVNFSDIEILDGWPEGADKLWTSVVRRRGQLPEVMRDMLQIADRLAVFWQSKSEVDGRIVYGEFFLQSPLLVASGNALPAALQQQKQPGIDMRTVREFDYYARNGGPIHALLPVVDDVVQDRIFIYDEVEALSSQLTCETYLQALVKTRGFFFWQYLFCEKRIQSFDVDSISNALTFLEQAFGEDCADLRQRLKNAPKQRD